MRLARHVASIWQRRDASRVVGKPCQVSRILGMPRHRWEENIKKNLKQIVGNEVGWIDLA